MNIKKITLIALCGNAFAALFWFYQAVNGGSTALFFTTLAGPGTLCLFLYALYSKQP